MKNSKSKIIEGYFKTRLSFDPKRTKIWKEIAKYLQKFIPPNSVVLELGAGYCDFINNITAKEKYALDISPVIEKFKNKDVKSLIMSCTELIKLQENYFDVIFSSFLLEHLTDDELTVTMEGIYKVLKKGGKLILIQPNFRYAYKVYFDDFTHKKIFTHVSLADFVKSFNFEIELVKPKFLPFSFKSPLPKLPILTKIYLKLPFKPLGKNMLLIARKV